MGANEVNKTIRVYSRHSRAVGLILVCSESRHDVTVTDGQRLMVPGLGERNRASGLLS